MSTMTTTTTIELGPVRTYPGEPEVGPSLPTTAAPSIRSEYSGRSGSRERRASVFEAGGEPAPMSGELVTPALPPADKGMDAWRFLVAATVIETTVWGLPYTVGVLHVYWSTKLFPNDESTLTNAATLQTGLLYISAAVFGPLFTAFPRQQRYFQIIGLVTAVAALFGSAFVTKAYHLLITMGIFYPFAGALYLPCATLIYEWFVSRRGLATGIMFAGTGVGGTIWPLILQALLTRFGYKAAMISLAIGWGVLNAVCLVFIKRRVPIPKRSAQAKGHHAHGKIDWSVVKTPAFWIGFFVLLLTSMGNFNPTLWIPTFAETVGVTQPNGTVLVAIMNAASVPGNALTGWVSDRSPARITITGSCVLAAISVLALWGLGTSPALLVLFSIVWGLTALSFVSLWSKMIRGICKDDPRMSVLLFSMFASLRGVGNLTSGPISTGLFKTGAFRGAAGGYGHTNFGAVLIYTAGTIFAGGVVGAFFPK